MTARTVHCCVTSLRLPIEPGHNSLSQPLRHSKDDKLNHDNFQHGCCSVHCITTNNAGRSAHLTAVQGFSTRLQRVLLLHLPRGLHIGELRIEPEATTNSNNTCIQYMNTYTHMQSRALVLYTVMHRENT